jgi:hypothetical protein
MDGVDRINSFVFDLTARPLNELTYFFFAVFAVFAVQNIKPNQRHLSIEPDLPVKSGEFNNWIIAPYKIWKGNVWLTISPDEDLRFEMLKNTDSP